VHYYLGEISDPDGKVLQIRYSQSKGVGGKNSITGEGSLHKEGKIAAAGWFERVRGLREKKAKKDWDGRCTSIHSRKKSRRPSKQGSTRLG